MASENRRPRKPRKPRPRRRPREQTLRIKLDINGGSGVARRQTGEVVRQKCKPRAHGEPIWITAARQSCCPECEETVLGEVIGFDKESNRWFHQGCHPWTRSGGKRAARARLTPAEPARLETDEARATADCDPTCMPSQGGVAREVELDPKFKLSLKYLTTTKCPYCHEIIDATRENFVTCANCLARHHPDCWNKTSTAQGGQCCVCGKKVYAISKFAA